MIAPWMLAYKRPGTGIEPAQGEKVIGMRVRRNLARDTVLQWDDLVAPANSDVSFEDDDAVRKTNSNQPREPETARKTDA